MAKVEETAEIAVNGERFRNWMTVSVSRSFGGEPEKGAASAFTMTIMEPSDAAPSWSKLKLKPGDECTVYLAGEKAVTGYISVRQTAFNAVQHGVSVQGISKPGDTVNSSAAVKTGQFKNYGYEAIVKTALQPFGVDFKLKGQPESGNFGTVNVQYGESVWSFVERLSRMRRISLVDDANGNLVGHRLTGKEAPIAELQEGRNILQAQCVIRDDTVNSQVTAVQQVPGSDSAFGDDVRNNAATVKNSATERHRPLLFIAEEPGTKADMQRRAERERDEQFGTTVDCTIVVQGWQTDDGSLWLNHVGHVVWIYSPMLFPNGTGKQRLAIEGVESSQSEAGTLTTIKLVLESRLGAPGRPSPEGEGANPFGAATPNAKVET